MKKVLAFFLAILMTVVLLSALADDVSEEADDVSEEAVDVSEEAVDVSEEAAESQFEKVLLKKGSLIVKELISYKSVSTIQKTSNFDVRFQLGTLTDVETGTKYYALRMEHRYRNSEYDRGTSIGVLDLAEIDGAIAALEYAKEHISELKNYSEIVYTSSSGLIIGGYKDDRETNYFIKFSSHDTAFIPTTHVDYLIKILKEAKDSFE